MIDVWRSTMDNLSDVYYLVQLIVHQVFVYLWDLIIREFSWVATSDDFNAGDLKISGAALSHITADFITFTCGICALLFLLLILASKCEKDEETSYVSTVETTSADLQDDTSHLSGGSTSTNCLHACGDSLRVNRNTTKSNPSNTDFSRTQSSEDLPLSRNLFFGLTMDPSQYTQSTQTHEKMFYKAPREWLIRRTRSGHIYGKYPV